MLFTEGEDREYERMMKEVPKHYREPIKQQSPVDLEDERDCPYCLYYENKGKRCKYEHCIVFAE